MPASRSSGAPRSRRSRSGGGEVSRSAAAALPDGGRFVALDALRGIAALGVAAYHVEGGGPLFASTIVRNGWLWVDFFFVLSGFVIAASYGDRLSRGFPVARFMVLRLGRIYPLHALLLAIYLALELAWWAWQPAGWGLRAPFSQGRSPALFAAGVLLVQAFVPGQSAWNGQSWSISVELWLYLAGAWLWRRAGPHSWRFGLAAAGAAAAALLARVPEMWLLTPHELRGVAGFGLGMACWRWHCGEPTPRGTLAEGASLAVLAAVLWLPACPVPLADAVFAAVVVVFARERGVFARLLARPACVFLGTVSYSLYMVHALVIGRGLDLLRLAGLGELASRDGEPIRRIVAAPWLADALGLALVAACLPVAWLSWRAVEWPARAWSRRRAAAFGAGAAERSAPTV